MADDPNPHPSLQRILDELLAVPPVEGALVLTSQGRVLASRMPEGADERALAQGCRTLLTFAAGPIVSPDEIVRVDLRGTKGSTVLLRAGPDAILAVMTTTRTPESVSLELSRAAAEVRRAVA